MIKEKCLIVCVMDFKLDNYGFEIVRFKEHWSPTATIRTNHEVGIFYYKGQIVGNSGISIEQARLIAESVVDAVAFGRDYIANPDLVERIRLGA
jgi:2,4-dienoyl-CoA reductase-like NADH-dependent reductase (Old Yellow Enzyme family)